MASKEKCNQSFIAFILRDHQLPTLDASHTEKLILSQSSFINLMTINLGYALVLQQCYLSWRFYEFLFRYCVIFFLEKTKNMLLMGSLEASRTKAYLLPHISNGKGKQVIGPAFSKKAAPDKCITCGTVRFNAHLLKCEFCEKKICADCIRVCTGCEKIFCHVCSVIKYVFTLSCIYIFMSLVIHVKSLILSHCL